MAGGDSKISYFFDNFAEGNQEYDTAAVRN